MFHVYVSGYDYEIKGFGKGYYVQSEDDERTQKQFINDFIESEGETVSEITEIR